MTLHLIIPRCVTGDDTELTNRKPGSDGERTFAEVFGERDALRNPTNGCYPPPLANDKGMFGLAGLTVTFCRDGSMMRSMSSIGMAPSNT